MFKLSALESYNLINKTPDLIILDVRNIDEYNACHIKNSKLIPASELQTRITELEEYKNSPILVHCTSGGRSLRAYSYLADNGFKNIYYLKNGLNDWTYDLESF